ncbi:MAG: hypothetical protein FalmKO_44660 [Falsiruegeria mediterranea]
MRFGEWDTVNSRLSYGNYRNPCRNAPMLQLLIHKQTPRRYVGQVPPVTQSDARSKWTFPPLAGLHDARQRQQGGETYVV